ncbi:AimR family lysis-lysogeny pheromone receptor [Fictibacillus enclensis]|uniref:AimR family lysis-lysogeny pheromone receptor n=1 Tax=Fictibacillus enclensis TaxID=1017270 RepID=UPI0025A0C786|nr:AimR family lysis-lysogeny pheromone receptor [Fictibacillus enclensis]MDM5335800.1 AimR family lysis-lysogeny pheromone receptor [Fictibacillus enclensis]
MMPVKELVTKQINRLDLSFRQVAKAVGQNHTSLYNFVNRDTEMKFHSFVPIAYYLFPDNYQEIIGEYALQVKQPKNKKAGIEYCELSGQVEKGRKLLEKFQEEESLQEWIPLYDLLFLRKEKKLNPKELIEQSFELKVSSPELKILYRLMVGYAYNDLYKFEVCYELLEGLKPLIEQVTNGYMRLSLMVRHNELMGHLSLHVFGDIQTSRQYNSELIAADLVEIRYKGSAHYGLGCSYIFENYEKSVFHFEQAIELLEKSGRVETAKYVSNFWLALTHITHDRFSKVQTDDQSLVAYMYAKCSNTCKALYYLDSYEKENPISPFTVFVRGLALRDPLIIIDSMARYDSIGEVFLKNYARFAAIELGLPKNFINGIIKYDLKNFEGVEDFEKTFYRNVSSLDAVRVRRQFYS